MRKALDHLRCLKPVLRASHPEAAFKLDFDSKENEGLVVDQQKARQMLARRVTGHFSRLACMAGYAAATALRDGNLVELLSTPVAWIGCTISKDLILTEITCYLGGIGQDNALLDLAACLEGHGEDRSAVDPRLDAH